MGNAISRIVDSVDPEKTTKGQAATKSRKVTNRPYHLFRTDTGKYWGGWAEPGKPRWVSAVKDALCVSNSQADCVKRSSANKNVPTNVWEVRSPKVVDNKSRRVKDSNEVSSEEVKILTSAKWPLSETDKVKVEEIVKKYHGSRDSIRTSNGEELVAFATGSNGQPLYSFKQHAWAPVEKRVQDDTSVSAGGPMVEIMAVYEKGGKYYIRFAVTAGKIPNVVREPIEKQSFETLKDAKNVASYVASVINEGFDKARRKVKGGRVSDALSEGLKKGDIVRILKGAVPGRFVEVLEAKEDGGYKVRDLVTQEVWEESKDSRFVFAEVTDSSEKKSAEVLLANPPKWARDKKAFEKAVKEISERDGDVDFTKLIIAYKRWEDRVIDDDQLSELEITDDKDYTKEQLIANPPKWVANKELWAECVEKATKGGTRSINVVVPLVIYKRLGGEKAKSKAEREAQAQVDARRMSAETSRENVEDAAPRTLKERIDAILKSGHDVKAGILSAIATYLQSRGLEATVSEDRVNLKSGNVRYDKEQILVDNGTFTEFHDVEDYEDWGNSMLELTM